MVIRSFTNSRQRQADTGWSRKERLQQGRRDRLKEKAMTGKTPLMGRQG